MRSTRIGTAAIGRRAMLAGVTATALAAPAIAQSLRKIVLVYGVQTLEGVSDGFFSSIPIGMGFYRDEGLDVEVQTVGGASAALNLLASGRVQFSTHGTAGLFSGVDEGIDMLGFNCEVPAYFGAIGVDADGPIKTFGDLRGKTIGINAVRGSPDLVLRAIAQKTGWQPGKDFTTQVVGTSLPALDALKKDRIQAIATWDTIFAGFEFRGQKFRYFRPDPIPQLGFTHATCAMRSTMKADPALLAGMTRAINKAVVMTAAAQPEELTKLHYKIYPASKPTGLSEEDALRLDALRQKARAQNMRFKERVFDRTETLGDSSDTEIAGQRDLLLTGDVIKKDLPPDQYFTREFLKAGSDFDFPALIARAKAFRA